MASPAQECPESRTKEQALDKKNPAVALGYDRWDGKATYNPTGSKRKQGYQIFLPGSRTKLKEEAKWWFEHSDGDVSIVLIIAINQAYVRFEIVQRPLQIAPCTTQPRPYSVQQVITTPSTVTGGPMILPFQTLYDRGRGQIETGIAITAEDLRDIADDISWINLNEG
ncbi:hypothetical protein ASPWEDRAFT_180217 [Aspergillus wentii DTO 134E9]|uniref:Uncharacterized protein n=1 Tax=Aspergillus wentii DTO 134E9 TaxID=1073089 RepID=A0A1L9RUW0_ASPWE|nr:uncharacterized protein ASPWEDRAFT_180217 [Aspergillus wentii DTO 134E9]OJJ38706.1 hypothetical protein ASPWEDRAFT_180217 [Aspergillus wentii DTO 134E9]